MPIPSLRTARLYFDTVRHLRPSQVAARLSLLGKHHLWPAARYDQRQVGANRDFTPVRNAVRVPQITP